MSKRGNNGHSLYIHMYITVLSYWR